MTYAGFSLTARSEVRRSCHYSRGRALADRAEERPQQSIQLER